MALQIKIDKARGLVMSRGSGDISDADIAAMEHTFETDPDFSRKFNRICDLSDAADVTISEERMNKWAQDPVMERSARHAIVCTRPAIMGPVLEFVRQSRSYARDVSVFPSLSQAEKWVEDRDVEKSEV